MKQLLFILIVGIISTNLFAQDAKLMIQRVERDGTKPPSSRYYLYEDELNKFFQKNDWKDEILSIKEIWVERPDNQSYYWIQIKTKNSGGAFYMHYDPYWAQAEGSFLAVEPSLWPPKFQKYIDDYNAKLEAEEKARKEEELKAEKLAMENKLSEEDKLDVQLLNTELSTVDKLMIEQGLEKVYDADGNSYRIVRIGNQIWMAENLKTTKYSDGTIIPSASNNNQWTNLSTAAYCWYNNDSTNKNRWGALYNYFAISDSHNVCPSNWHVPTQAEWKILIDYLGGMKVAGGEMYSGYRNGYRIQGLTNNSHFNALMGGGEYSGKFADLKAYGYYWTSTSLNLNEASGIQLQFESTALIIGNGSKIDGNSVRCIKNESLKDK